MSLLTQILQDSTVATPYAVNFSATVAGSGNTSHGFVIVTGESGGWILEAGAADIILDAIRTLETASTISGLQITKYQEGTTDITSSGD